MRSKTLWREPTRITEAEDRISELEDRMVEINETERKKKKEKGIKRNEDNLRPLGQCEKPQHLNHRSPRRRRQKERP